MSITETLKTTGQQVAKTAADAATKRAQQQIDKAAGGAKKQAATAKQTVDTATTTLTKATDVGQLKQGLTTTAVSAAASQLPSAVQPITNMAAQQVASTVGTLGTIKQKSNAQQTNQVVTKTIEGTQTSAIQTSTKPARRIDATIRIGKKTIEQFISLDITESYAAHHEMRLVVPSPNMKEEKGIALADAAELIGELVEVSVTNVLDGGAPKHELKMLVTGIDVEQIQGHNNIVFICHSPTCILDAAPNFETMCDKNFKEIMNEMCKPLDKVNVKTKLENSIETKIPFVCRYDETHFAFIKRMSDVYKQWCYFNGKELVIGQPERDTPIKLAYNENCTYLKMSMELKSVHIGHHDYNAESHEPLEKPAAEEGGKLGLWGTQVFNKSKKLLTEKSFAYNQAVASNEVIEKIAKADTGSRAASMFVVTGSSYVYELKMGALASIDYNSAPEEKDKMDVRIVGITHRLGGNGTYSNSFTAIPAGVAAPPAVEYVKPHTHTLEAEIISTDDDKHLGRVKACFLGPKGSEGRRYTNWIRVATPDAGGGHEKVGKNAGFVAIPEKGSHVKIGFENGDPHCPYVMSAIFHGKTAGGGGKGNNVTSLTSKSGNTVTLNDDGTITITNTKSTIVLKGNEIEISAPDKITLASKVINIMGDDEVNIGAKAVTVDGSNTADFVSSSGTCTTSGKTEAILASETLVSVGAPKVEATAEAALKIAGKAVNIEGMTTNIKGDTMLALN